MTKQIILVDTREQKPLWIANGKSIIKQKLDEGDYTYESLLNIAHAERKSGIDLYGSILRGHKRFTDEIKRAAEKNIKFAIFCECPERVFYSKKFQGGYRLMASPASLAKTVKTMTEKYDLNFIWCNGRTDMKVKIKEWLDSHLGNSNIYKD